MTHQPKVSIVIPVYNGSEYLREAIDSALAQTYPNIEIVVVNDGSQDNDATERIALSYGDKIRYFSKQNGGVASALNRAIVEMTGEYFSWLSHDDLYFPNKVSAQMQALEGIAHADAILYSDWATFSDDPHTAQEIRMPKVAPEQFRYFLTTANVLHGCTLLIPRRAFGLCGTFNDELRTTQDYDLWFRLAEKFRFVQLPEVLVKGRHHEAQGSIRMKDVALTEINILLSGFTRELTVDDVASAGHKSMCMAYAEIAASFWRRHFYTAAREASRLALSRLRDGPPGAAVKAVFILSRAVSTTVARVCALRYLNFASTLGMNIRKLLGSIKYRLLRPRSDDLQQKFSLIYSGNTFGGKESRSGAGSDLQQTREVRRLLPALIQEFDVQTLMDAPCGDLFWMRTMQLSVKKYIGVDIVATLIEKDRREFANEVREFLCLNLAQDDLPCVDLILCRDCLVHLNFADVQRVLSNFRRSGSRYLLTTTFPWRDTNRDLVGKDIWRTLNLQKQPFKLPPPLRLFNEMCSEGNGAFADKSLGLWRLSDIEMNSTTGHSQN